jgi:hypothetical protein
VDQISQDEWSFVIQSGLLANRLATASLAKEAVAVEFGGARAGTLKLRRR